MSDQPTGIREDERAGPLCQSDRTRRHRGAVGGVGTRRRSVKAIAALETGGMLDQLPAANPYSSKSQLTDATGLVPCSKEWVQHWYRKIDRVIAGEKNVDMRG